MSEADKHPLPRAAAVVAGPARAWAGAALAGLALPWLAACTDRQLPQQGCLFEHRHELAVRQGDGALTTRGLLEATPVEVVIDTGSSVSIVPQPIMVMAGLRELETVRRLSGGIGSLPIEAKMAVGKLSLTGMPFDQVEFALTPLVRDFWRNRILLGLPDLESYSFTLDLGNSRILLYRPAECGADLDQMQLGGHRIDLAAGPIGLMYVPVQVNGKALLALVDTGANSSAISTQAAHAVGISDQDLLEDPNGRAYALGNTVMTIRHHRFEDVRIGTIDLGRLSMSVGAYHIPDDTLILGLDVLRRLRLSKARGSGSILVQEVQ